MFTEEYSKNPSLDQSSSFLGCHFSNITFSDLRLCEKTMCECIFREVTFQNCQIISTIFSECHFIHCQFKNYKIVSSSIEECSFSFSSAQQCDSTNNRIFNSFFCDCSFFNSNSEYDIFCYSSFFSEENTTNDCALTYSTIRDCFGLLPTCPEKGSFIGFKQLKHDIIVELEIPADAYRILKDLGFQPSDFETVKQGFIAYEIDPDDPFNGTETFLDRKEALAHAKMNRQILTSISDDELYSEDLY